MPHFIRKRNRIPGFDYSSANIYLLTVCTDRFQCMFGVVSSEGDTQRTILSPLGELVEEAVLEVPAHYPNVTVDAYSILPNHLHLLLRLDPADVPNPPTVGRIIQQMKGFVTKACGKSVWEKGFHDRVIRSEQAYENAWNYVTYNPAKWETDEYFTLK